MRRLLLPLLVTVSLSLLSVGADYLLKRASELPQPFRSPQFVAAALIYAGSTVGWVYVLRHIKLASVGAVYSVIIVILLAIMGVTIFRETLTTTEWVGIGCAVLALVLLGRFMAP
jgi:multidrug transporter EmrE-like cation transporter